MKTPGFSSDFTLPLWRRPRPGRNSEHQALARIMMQDRDEIAKRHGCASGDALLAISEALPMLPCDVMQVFIARPPDGHYFVWVGEPQPKPPTDEPKPVGATSSLKLCVPRVS